MQTGLFVIEKNSPIIISTNDFLPVTMFWQCLKISSDEIPFQTTFMKTICNSVIPQSGGGALNLRQMRIPNFHIN